MRKMKHVSYLIVAAGLFCVFTSQQASAQLFRFRQDNASRDNYSSPYSNLPGANPNAVRAPDYGAEQVSEAIRNEVNGRVPVNPVPDFESDAPLALAAKQYQLPAAYMTQPPLKDKDGERVEPPMTKSLMRTVPEPHWIEPYPETETTDSSGLLPIRYGKMPTFSVFAMLPVWNVAK